MKGKSLYLDFYNHEDHQALADFLSNSAKFKWVLSYDSVPKIREMYQDFDKKFRSLAKRGRGLVKKMYLFGTDVRNRYYQIDEIPQFDSSIIKNCKLKYKLF